MKRLCLCPWCQAGFRPDPRLGRRQKTCGHSACKRRQANLKLAEWKVRNRDVYQNGQKDWRAEHPDYWKNYRRDHSEYVAKNRRQTLARKAKSRLAKGLQKKIDNPQHADKYMLFLSALRFAKECRSSAISRHGNKTPCTNHPPPSPPF